MTAGKKITIHDVAKQAGVAISSVSRVLTDHPHVSETMRARVLAAAQALGYQPDFLAHSLRSGSTDSIGFLVGTIFNPVMADLSVSIANVMAEHGYAMLLVCSQNQPELDVAYLRFLIRRQVGGLIVSSATHGPEQAAALIAESEVPAVMLDRECPPGAHVSAVQSDHASGVEAAVAHLVEQGHRRIALVNGPPFFDPSRARRQGFQQAMHAAHLTVEPSFVRTKGMDKNSGYQETCALLALPQRPTAIIAGGNLILTGVLQALQEHHIQVGCDMALIGCDDTDLTRLYSPAITVIARDLSLLGETAARLLVENMNTGSGGKSILLPTQLVIRASSLCPPV